MLKIICRYLYVTLLQYVFDKYLKLCSRSRYFARVCNNSFFSIFEKSENDNASLIKGRLSKFATIVSLQNRTLYKVFYRYSDNSVVRYLKGTPSNLLPDVLTANNRFCKTRDNLIFRSQYTSVKNVTYFCREAFVI